MEKRLKPFEGKKILIIGGAGFIGSHLADVLAMTADFLYIVDGFVPGSGANPSNLTNLNSKNIELIRDDLGCVERWGSIIEDVDIVFNLASVNAHKESMKDPITDYHRNSEVHLKFMLYCRTLKKPLSILFASTRSVYGSVANNPVKETAPCFPRDFYSAHTLLAEQYYRILSDATIQVSCVRFSNIFGPRMRLRGNDIGLYGELLRSALNAEPMSIYGAGDALRDTLDVDNLIEGILAVAAHPTTPFRIVNLGGRAVSVIEFAKTIRKFIPEAEIRYHPFPENLKLIQVGDVILDSTLAREIYHWEPRLDLERALQQTIQFYQQKRELYL